MIFCSSRGPLRGSKRGSRWSIFLVGTTSRLRETAFLEETSAGACLDEREKSRWSFLPALRSRASESRYWLLLLFVGWDGRGLSSPPSSPLLRFRLPRVSCAATNAPKEIEAACSSGPWLENSESDYTCSIPRISQQLGGQC